VITCAVCLIQRRKTLFKNHLQNSVHALRRVGKEQIGYYSDTLYKDFRNSTSKALRYSNSVEKNIPKTFSGGYIFEPAKNPNPGIAKQAIPSKTYPRSSGQQIWPSEIGIPSKGVIRRVVDRKRISPLQSHVRRDRSIHCFQRVSTHLHRQTRSQGTKNMQAASVHHFRRFEGDLRVGEPVPRAPELAVVFRIHRDVRAVRHVRAVQSVEAVAQRGAQVRCAFRVVARFCPWSKRVVVEFRWGVAGYYKAGAPVAVIAV